MDTKALLAGFHNATLRSVNRSMNTLNIFYCRFINIYPILICYGLPEIVTYILAYIEIYKIKEHTKAIV